MSQTRFKQCRMRRGSTVQVSWLPEQFAVEGMHVELRGDDRTWADGWQVVGVAGTALAESILRERSQDYKRTRKASDI